MHVPDNQGGAKQHKEGPGRAVRENGKSCERSAVRAALHFGYPNLDFWVASYAECECVCVCVGEGGGF